MKRAPYGALFCIYTVQDEYITPAGFGFGSGATVIL